MGRWAGTIKPLPWVSAVTVTDTCVRVTVTDVVTARRELLASVAAQGLILRRYEEARPSLEDVFLQLMEKEAVE
jgi:ABC-type uncharacterized transport system ATPase subunit